MEMGKVYKLLPIAILLLTFVSSTALADMNAATPQAASFRVADSGGPAIGGDLQLQFPLLTVPGRGGLDIPVNLLYSSHDNTLRREATDAGFGFSLGAGSEITRSVNGVPDDYLDARIRRDITCSGSSMDIGETGWLLEPPTNGQFTHYSERYSPYALECEDGSYGDLIGVFRGNPDSFYISINGQGGEMMADRNGKFRMANVKPWKIDYTCDPDFVDAGCNRDILDHRSGIKQFVITAEDGTRYVFRDLGLVTRTKTSICDADTTDGAPAYQCGNYDFQQYSTEYPYTFSWPLIYIESGNYEDIDGVAGPSIGDRGNWVRFEYETYGSTTSANKPAYNVNYTAISQYGVHTFTWAKITSSSTVTNYNLKSITTPVFNASFIYSFRSAYDTSKPGLKKLDEITLTQNQDEVPASPVLKKIRFTYNSGGSMLNGRLTLKSVQEFGSADSSNLPPTQFFYTTSACSGGIENGYGLCNSRIDAFLLSAVKYPTGGRAEYIYEPDAPRYLQDVDIPGWAYSRFADSGTRIKTVKSYDGVSADPATANYYYGGGVAPSNQFCRKLYTFLSDSTRIDCDPRGSYVYSESDIGANYVNNVVYSRIATETEPAEKNGVVVQNYYTPLQNPYVCSSNGNCLTSLDYQYGLPTLTLYTYNGYDFSNVGWPPLKSPQSSDPYGMYSSIEKAVMRNYYRDDDWALRLVNGKDRIYDNRYGSGWSSSGASGFAYKIEMLDWDNLDKDDGLIISKPRKAPDYMDTYAFVSTGNFLKAESVFGNNYDGATSGTVTQYKSYGYESGDIPDSGYSLNPDSYINFNGVPKTINEYLSPLNDASSNSCSLRSSGMPDTPDGYKNYYYYCPSAQKIRSAYYTFAFQSNPDMSSRNMKTQPLTVTIKDGSTALSHAKTGYNTFNGNQIYAMDVSQWVDRNNDGSIGAGEFAVTEYQNYDIYGNVLELKDPAGTVKHIRYDGTFGRYPVKAWSTTQLQEPIIPGVSEANPEAYNEYDRLGNLIRATDVNSKTTAYGYDALGRLSSVRKPDDASPSQMINYNYAGASISSNNLNYVEMASYLDPALGLNTMSRSYADGQGKVKQTEILESNTYAIRVNNEYYPDGKLKNAFMPVKEQRSALALSAKPYANENSFQGQASPNAITGEMLIRPKIPPRTAYASAYVKTNTDPTGGADIYANGQPKGKSPRTIILPTGGYGDCGAAVKITAKRTNYTDASKCITPISGQSQTVSLTLPKLLGDALVTVTGTGDLSAKIYLDNNLVGITDAVTGNLLISDIAPGLHTVTVKHLGYYPINQDVMITANQLSTVSISLPPLMKYGRLAVASSPSGADVRVFYPSEYVIYRTTTSNPNDILWSLPIGANRIILSRPGYEDYITDVDIQECDPPQPSCYSILNPSLVQMQKKAVSSGYYRNPLDQIEVVVNPDATETTYQYRIDKISNSVFSVTRITDENGGVSENFYDGFGNLVMHKDADNKITYYEYNLLQKPTRITNPASQITTNQYDTLGRLTLVSSPDFGQITNKYNDSGNLVEENQNGQVITYQYDGLDRMKTVTYSTGQPQVAYTYDSCSYTEPGVMMPSNAKGRLCKVANGYITKEFAYDDRGRVWRAYHIVDGKSYYLTYHYDSNDNLVSISNSASPYAVSYQYNRLNQVEKIYAGGDEFSAAYNPEGTINTINYPNIAGTSTPSSTVSYTYDSRNRMTLFDIRNPSGTLLKEKMTYDDTGNVIKLEELDASGNALKHAGFAYDSMYRLTQAYNPDIAIQSKYFNVFDYSYDPVGNRQKENKVAYQYEVSNKNRLAHTESVSYVTGQPGTIMTDYTYDGNGNMKTKAYNKEYTICGIATSTTIGGGDNILLAIYDNLPAGSQVTAIYDLNTFSGTPPGATLQNKHYEWAANAEAASSGLQCNGAPATKMIRIDAANLQAQKSDNDADSSAWYTPARQIPNFKAYNPSRQTDTYYYDAENRLVAINGDGACSNYFYDESGLRIKKIENDIATIYINHGGNPVYEESYPGTATCYGAAANAQPSTLPSTSPKTTPLSARQTTPSALSPSYRCSDTDNGMIYGIRGTATVTKTANGATVLSRTDSCAGDKLIEYLCPSTTSQSISSIATKCPGGCADGVCLPAKGALDAITESISSGAKRIVEKIA